MSYNEELQSNNDALRDILDEVNALPNGTGGVQPDWNQNDPAARDFIKNRPFYDDEKWHIAHEVQEFVSTPSGIDWIIGSDNIFDTVPIGTKCRIVVDGATYIGTMAAEPEDTGYYHRYIGNGYLKNSALPDTGEPFVFFASGLDCMAMIPCDTMPSAATISVLESGKLVRIDPKFLPEPVQSDYWQNDPAAPDYIKNRPVREAERNCIIERELDGGVALNDPEFVALLYKNRQNSTYIVDGAEYYFGEDMVFDDTKWSYTIRNESLALTRFVFATASGDTGIDTIRVITSGGDAVPAIIGVPSKVTIFEIDPKYLPSMGPYVIDAEAYTYGDDALAAILAGRQIYVKVPSQIPGGLYANFMPVIQYQLPQSGNDYLTLIYLKDGLAQNIMAALQTGSFDAVYGQIVMLLSQSYDDCPLKVSPIK